MTASEVADRLGATRSGDGWSARCPAHDDHRPSLSIREGADGRVLLHCFAGCSFDAVVEALGLSTTDLFEDALGPVAAKPRIVKAYDYTDAAGTLLCQSVRYEPKAFKQRRPSGDGDWIWNLKGVPRVPYRLPELQGKTEVYIVEGEKDADRLWALGFPATTNVGGAGKWRQEHADELRAAGVQNVVILPDNDDPGRAHAEKVARSCQAAGLRVTMLALPDVPPKGDVSDWLNQGHTRGELLALVTAAPRDAPRTTAPSATADTGRLDLGKAIARTPPPAPCGLADTLAVFRRWLCLDDPTPVYAVAAALVANRAPGDPVWLLLVCAPSTGKTELLSAATRLPWVVSAAKVTEASLLSGTSKRECAADATGGLLRQIGNFGVLLAKDFTSVLAQNKDARAEAMAALREVYDGEWHRPVGTDGGKVLIWRGKCGFIGGVTPALDQYGQVVSALGDRFVLLRMPDANVDDFGAAALRHGEHERQMRHELREALAGLVEHVDVSRVNRPLSQEEQTRLIRLAAFTARARTAVVRDGYAQDVMFLPQVEGPGRLVKAYARLLGGLEAVGCDSATSWATLTRIAVDCAPALRTRVIRELATRPAPARTADLAEAVECATKTASRHLEDLTLLRLAKRTKHSAADNAPDLWEATTWLREYWPESETEKYPPQHKTQVRVTERSAAGRPPTETFTPLCISQSHFDGEVAPAGAAEPVEPDLSDPSIGAHAKNELNTPREGATTDRRFIFDNDPFGTRTPAVPPPAEPGSAKQPVPPVKASPRDGHRDELVALVAYTAPEVA